MPSIFSRLWYQVREIPDVKVNLVRAGELGSYARQVIPGWILPLGMIGGWLVFPALTQSFKTEVLGFKAPPSGMSEVPVCAQHTPDASTCTCA